MNEEEVGAPPLASGHGRGGAPLSYKKPPLLPHKAHLLVKDISPPLDILPHGLGLARYMFPMACRLEGVAASADLLERGGGGCTVA